MIIRLIDSSLVNTDYTVTLMDNVKSSYIQNIDYVTSMNGQTQAYNNGPTFDKWASSITIQGLKDDIYTLATAFEDTIRQVTITTDEGELLFGAGIDYTNTFLCNVTNNSIPYPLTNITLAELKLSIQPISSNGVQLAFKSSLSGTLPVLNYQNPVSRTLNKTGSVFLSEEFGSFGNTVPVDSSGKPIKSYSFPLSFIQTEEEAGNIEKFYSIQRTTPFLWLGLDCLDLFIDVATDEVMITKLSSTRLEFNNWKVNLTIITNV